MFWQSVLFQLNLFHHYLVGQYFREEIILDNKHFHYRRFHSRYKKKLLLVKNIWIASGLIIIAFPLLSVAVILSIVATFASFSLLDETE